MRVYFAFSLNFGRRVKLFLLYVMGAALDYAYQHINTWPPFLSWLGSNIFCPQNRPCTQPSQPDPQTQVIIRKIASRTGPNFFSSLPSFSWQLFNVNSLTTRARDIIKARSMVFLACIHCRYCVQDMHDWLFRGRVRVKRGLQGHVTSVTL